MKTGIFQLDKQQRHFHTRYNFLILSYCILLLAFITYPLLTRAEAVSEIMDNGLTALADYRTGNKSKPALVILHGFLQTHNFSMIQSMTDELADSGYTILAPTLTLGIDKRTQSMTCDLIQSHQFGDHHAELDHWIAWLAHQGHKEIILIGHSSGGLRILSYSDQQHKVSASILGLIAINPTMPHSANDITEINKNLNKARSLLSDDNNEPHKFTLAYCNNTYTSSAAAYFSYTSISENTFYSYLKKNHHPVVMIMGTEDKLSPINWSNKLKKQGAKIINIDGANHFFNNGHEFELFDSVINAVQQLVKPLH